MASSLAAQLAQGASLNKSLLADRSRRKPVESYLFTPREAAAHDLEAIHALGVNALSQLKTVEPLLALYEDALFSDAAKTKDRTLQTAAANAALDRDVQAFLLLLGPYILEATTGKVIEWLVRRFRINEFNVEAVLSVFIPYHDAPHFQKMLSILHIRNDSQFAALLPFKSTSTPLTHDALVAIMLQPPNSDFARFVGGLLPAAAKTPHAPHALHRTLVALHTGALFAFVRRTFGVRGKGKHPAADAGTAAWVLLAATEPLQLCAEMEVERPKESLVGEVVLSSYLLLSALAHTCPLSAKAFAAVLKAVAACAPRVSTKQVVRTYASVFAGQDADVTGARPLPKSVVRALLQLPGVAAEVQGVFAYVGTERFVNAFGKALVSRLDETHAFDVLTALVTVTAPSLPLATAAELACALVRAHLEGADAENQDQIVPARARAILVHIQQRYPVALQHTFEAALRDPDFADKKEAVEQLLLSLSVALPVAGPGALNDARLDAVVASTSADAPVRAVAVRQLYEQLSRAGVAESERTSIRSALLARVQDPHASVLEALYAAPLQLLPLVLDDVPAYVDALAGVLHAGAGAGTPNKNAVRAHVGFVAAHLYPALAHADPAPAQSAQAGRAQSARGHADRAFAVLLRVLFPFLLFSKPRQKTSAAVWALIAAGEGAEGCVARAELLAGCVDAVRWEEQKGAGGAQEDAGADADGAPREYGVEMMAKINLALASKIADNIFSSASLEKYFAALLEQLQSSNTHARALAYLICRALLSRLSGAHLIDAAHRVLAVMDLQSLEGMHEFLKGTQNLQAFLHDASLSAAVVLKPSKLHTLHRLQVAILANMPTIPRPAGDALDWLIKPATSGAGSGADSRGARYVELMRTVYRLANSSAAVHSLSAHLIRTLFINLGDDALKFLAGTWLYSDGTASARPEEFAALRHAAAFLEAHYATQRWVDFQTVLPAFLVALQHGDRRVREAALECVSALVRLSQATKPTGIYAFDVIYGAASADLQYLEWSDLCRYVQALQTAREHLLNDAAYLRLFHQEHLATVSFEAKKEAGYKKRVLCYLLSHVVGCPLPQVKTSLLSSVEAVSSSAKSQMLQPVLEALSSEKTASQTVELFGASYDEFASLVVASIDETAPEHLNNTDDGLWAIYQAVLHYFFRPDVVSPVRAVLSQKLQVSIFPALQLERKVELCRTLLELGQQSDVANECRALLSGVLNDVPVIIQLVTAFQPATIDTARRANKRTKLEAAKNDEHYPSLVLLAETLGSKPLPGSVELVSCLLETLSKVILDVSSSETDKSYVEQLLMSALENAAVNVSSNTGRAPSAIRLDTLVELIRVSDNPQTFNQALLLMATLARLSPEAVLHNVMPVFTFMGSNVFHRDDAYSFRVVQKTIDSIVPVMVSSLKESPASPLDLYISARSFLRIFTDAVNHIPRHRRTNFFGHLVDVLGPNDFLAPVCMLLVDKFANRVARQSSEESASSLSLPLSALQRYGKDLQLATVVEILHEAQRLIELELQTDSTAKTFLEAQQDEERSDQSSVVKRQVFALLVFASHALKQLSLTPAPLYGEQSNTELLSILLDIAVSKTEQLTKAGMGNVSTLAGDIVKDALLVMPAANFVTGVLAALNSGETTIQQGALTLFAEQLANVAEKVRQDARTNIGRIIETTRKLLSSASSEPLRAAALHALGAIADSLIPGEEHALTGTVPVVLKAVVDTQTTLPALKVLFAQSRKLGPRLIPYFKDIVKECSRVVRIEDQSENICSQAVGVLQGLLSSIPNFWSSSEYLQVINIYLDTRGSSSKPQLVALSSLIKTVSKKAPSKLLLTTLCDIWPSLNTEPVVPKLQGYFSILKRVVHVSDRAVVSDNLRPLFKVFSESFELFASSPSTRESVEIDSVSAFIEVVVKLNEAAFKPLFRRMYDWAFSSDMSEIGIGRRLVFCQVYMALIDYFKNLITPYMSFLLQPFSDALQTFTKSSGNQELWLTIVNTLTKSFTLDEGAFWRDEKLQLLLAPIVAQVAIGAQLHNKGKTALSECLIAFANALSDDALLKRLNMDLLMHTRSEEARIRLYALTCSEALWREHGEKFIGFSAETATFIVECAEDDNDSVAREAHRLKSAVESVAGRIEV